MKIGETNSMHDTITGQQQENAILQGELKRLANVDQRNTQLEKKLSDTRSRNLKLNEACAKASEARKVFEGELNLARTQIEKLNREVVSKFNLTINSTILESVTFEPNIRLKALKPS